MHGPQPYPNQNQLWPNSDEREDGPNQDPPNISKDETAGLQIAPRGGTAIQPEGKIRGPRREQDINQRFAEYDEDRGPWRQYQHDPM